IEVPAPAGILRTAVCSSATLSENAASCVTFSSKAKTDRRSPGRSTWRIKWAAASCSKLISLWALRLESIMMARSSGCEVSDSNLSIFCPTPSSNRWKASLGRSGAGRFFSSRTLTRTLTRLTLTRMRPRWEEGSCESFDVAGGVGWTILPGSPSGAEAVAVVEVEVELGLAECDGGEEQRRDGEEQSGVGAKGCHRNWELRCRFRAWRRPGYGGKLAVGPDGAVFEVFFLPDGHGALEGVDGEAASVKGGGAVGGADDDEDAGFADLEAAEAVDHGDAMDAVFFVELRADFAHFGEGHGFVGFVVEVKGWAIVGLVADETVEDDDGAVFGRAHVAGERGHVDRLAHQLIDVIVGERRHGVRQPPLTGGRKATSSPERSGVSQAANSWLREATTEERYLASSGWRAA